jgi:hypothetical protein
MRTAALLKPGTYREGETRTRRRSEGSDLGGPFPGVAVLPHRERHHLIQVRQLEVLEIDQLELGVAALAARS